MILLLSCRRIPFCLLTSLYTVLAVNFFPSHCEREIVVIQVACNNILADLVFGKYPHRRIYLYFYIPTERFNEPPECDF